MAKHKKTKKKTKHPKRKRKGPLATESQLKELEQFGVADYRLVRMTQPEANKLLMELRGKRPSKNNINYKDHRETTPMTERQAAYLKYLGSCPDNIESHSKKMATDLITRRLDKIRNMTFEDIDAVNDPVLRRNYRTEKERHIAKMRRTKKAVMKQKKRLEQERVERAPWVKDQSWKITASRNYNDFM